MIRKLSIRIATIGLTLAALLASTSPASASTVLSQTTNRGSYQLSMTTGGASIYMEPFLDTGVTSVWRSPAYGGIQRVTLDYRIWRFTSQTGWVTELVNGAPTFSRSVDLNPGYYMPFASQHLLLDGFDDAIYSVQWTIHWATTNGVEFASVAIGLNQITDYACSSTRGCAVGSLRGVGAIAIQPMHLVNGLIFPLY